MKTKHLRYTGLAAVSALAIFAALTLRAHPPVTECPPACEDFMTGGGWIPCLEGGNFKVSFGFVGGFNRRLFGHFNSIDHCLGHHIIGETVTGYCFITTGCPPNPDAERCRRIVYSGTFDGTPSQIMIEACDNNEPGNQDTISIKVWIGSFPIPSGLCDTAVPPDYERFGTLGNGQKGGGNLQLHRLCR